MSKLSFRARALDPSKPMPIYLAEELPDLPEYSAINRAVPQMPSGMEKEEESEHHLQRAICTGLIIPTPEVFATEKEFYDNSYPPNYKMPRQMIHMQPLGLEQDIPDYDMDSADEMWVNQQSRRLDLTPIKFEQMMDRLEKSSGQTVVTLNEAKALLKQDDEISIAVYDYWLNKRLKTQHPLILSVKTENRSGAAANNPYLAFRRRTEKMQTRKNRKNDETSYEKMLKLRRDLSRAVTLLEMVKRREKTKREQLHLSIEIFEKRYQARDFSGSVLSELHSSIKSSRPAFAPIYSNQYSHHSSSSLSQTGILTSSSAGVGGVTGVNSGNTITGGHHYTTSQYLNSSLSQSSTLIGNSGSSSGLIVGVNSNKRDLDSIGSRKEKRQYKKRKHKLQRDKQYSHLQNSSPAAIESTLESDEDDNNINNTNHLINNSITGNIGGSGAGSDGGGEDDGLYAFRRNKNCEYHKPLTKEYGNWPWESKEDNGIADPKYRFTLTSIRYPRPRCIGFGRRRIGRGGRILIDRVSTNLDDFWSQLDYTIFDNNNISCSNNSNINNKNICNNNNNSNHQNNKLPLISSLSTIQQTINEQPLTTTTTTTTTIPSIKIENDNLLDNNSNDDNNENISRDPSYISASIEPIKCPLIKKYNNNNKVWNNNNHINNKNLINFNNNNNNLKTTNFLNIYNNNKQKLIENNSISNNNIISNYLQNKKIKCEDNIYYSSTTSTSRDCGDGGANSNNHNNRIDEQQQQYDNNNDVGGICGINKNYINNNNNDIDIKWMTTTTTDELNNEIITDKITNQNNNNIDDDDNIVDLVRLDEYNNSKNPITNNNNFNLNRNLYNNKNDNILLTQEIPITTTTTTSSSSPSSNNNNLSILRTNNNNDKFNVIKDEVIIKKEPIINIDTSDNINDLLDDENVNLACLSSYINASRHNIKQQQQQQKLLSSLLSSSLSSTSSQQQLTTTTVKNNNIFDKNNEILIKNEIINIDGLSNFDILKNQSLSSNLNNNNQNLNIRTEDLSSQQQQHINIDDDDDNNNNSLIYNQFLNEIQKDWLHFRPKTPEELELSSLIDTKSILTTLPAVDFSEKTKITIEMQCLNNNNNKLSIINKKPQPPSSVFLNNNNNSNLNIINCDSNSNSNIISNSSHNNNIIGGTAVENCIDNSIFNNNNNSNNNNNDTLFITNPFAYSDLLPDDQLINSINIANNIISTSPTIIGGGDSSNSTSTGGIDFNISGDSLNELNLSLGEIDDNEKMLDNILQECQIDDLKTLNQTTNFWNGILEDGGNGILDVIDDKKSILLNDTNTNNNNNTINGLSNTLITATTTTSSSSDDKDINKKLIYNNKRKTIQQKYQQQRSCRIGSSAFSIINDKLNNEEFFKKDEPLQIDLNQSIKIEPPDEIMASPPPPQQQHHHQQQQPQSLSTVLQLNQQQQLKQPIQHKISIIPTNIGQISVSQATAIEQNLIKNNTSGGNLSHVSFTNNNRIISNTTNVGGPGTTTVAIVNSGQIHQQHQQQQIHTIQSNALPQAIFANLNLNQGGNINLIGNQKLYIKQEPVTNQVPNLNQQQQQQQTQNAVITLTNVKLENDIQTATVVGRSGIGNNSGTTTNLLTTGGNILTDNIGNSIISTGSGVTGNLVSVATQQGPIIVTSKQQQQQHPQQQQQQQHILWKPFGQGSQTAQIINVSSAGNLTDGQGGTIVLSGSPPNKQQRHINGPTDRNTIQNILKHSKVMNRKLHISQDQIQQQQQLHQLQQQQQQQQQLQLKQDDNIPTVVQNSRISQSQQQQTSNFIKMSPYPVTVVSESTNMQQQQQNSLSAVAVANHNYSLQPSAQPITIIGQPQSGSKIILNTTGTGGGVANLTGTNSSGNFTITTQTLQDMQNKIHYNKLKLVTSAGIQQATTGQQTTLGGSIITTTHQPQQHQQQQHQQRIKLDKTLNMYIDNEQKRVLYTKLVSLQHNKNAAAAAAAAIAASNASTSGNHIIISSSGNQQQQSTSSSVQPQQQQQHHQTLQITPQIITNNKGGHTTVHRLTNAQAAIVTNMRLPVSNQITIGTAGTGVNASITGGNSGNDIISTSGSSHIHHHQQQQHQHHQKQSINNCNDTTTATGSSSSGGNNNTSSSTGGINLNTTNR